MLLNDRLGHSEELRRYAVKEVVGLPIIQRCGKGESKALEALLCGFWRFVLEFQNVVRNETRFPMDPLYSRYGRQKVVLMMRATKSVLNSMSEEEGMHADVWRKGAVEVGFQENDMTRYEVPAVKYLIDVTRIFGTSEEHMYLFFCHLAATEYVAEEISRYLVAQNQFLACFPISRRWQWGDIHLMEHSDGPSHREIDEDLAIALCPLASSYDAVAHGIRSSIDLFRNAGIAAMNEVG